MDIETLLGTDLFKEVQEKLGDKKLILNDGSMVPRTKLNEHIDKAKLLKEKLDSFEKQISDTTDMLKNNVELKKSYEELQGKYSKDLQMKDKEIENVLKKSLVKEDLIKSGAKHIDLLLKEINLDAFEVNDGKLKDNNNTLKTVKETYADLFVTTVDTGGKASEGDKGNGQIYDFSKL